MSFEDKRKALENHCINNGKMGKDEMDAEIARMAGMCPPATATEKGLTTDVDKAYEVLMIMEGNQAAPASPAQTQAAGVSQPVAGATAAEMAAVHANVMTNFEEKLAIGSNSQIVKYLLSRPAPESYIPAGTTGVIDQTKWMESIEKKISSGDYTVVDDYQDPKTMEMVPSKTNYETLKNAAANGTPVNVYRGKLGTRPQGYVIRVGSATSTGAKEETFTREMAMQFLTWKCNGFLGAPGQATIRLKSIQSKANKAIPGPRYTVQDCYDRLQQAGSDRVRWIRYSACGRYRGEGYDSEVRAVLQGHRQYQDHQEGYASPENRACFRESFRACAGSAAAVRRAVRQVQGRRLHPAYISRRAG